VIFYDREKLTWNVNPIGRSNIKIRGFSLGDVAYLGLHIRNIFHAYTHHKTP
jgi:hypothetical protein